ncbi:hypothetical protein [Fulvivirga sp.]|uniref:hypothetical protein n=1 Tax=Fulvivirga sp. TaxID=1931237 RepID=UPI0032EDD890
MIFFLIFNKIKLLKKDKPKRIAINGIEGTGKTIFAQSFVKFLNAQGKTALHISIDGFHYNQSHRYRQGRDSAKGYYEDSYNEMSFVNNVLLSSQQDLPTIVKATHNLVTDNYLDLSPEPITEDTILVTDGAYLFKPNLRKHWDYKIYLKTDFNTAMYRGVNRDAKLLGSLEKAREKYLKRYHEASRLYRKLNDPEGFADIIIDNTNFDSLSILKS